MLHLWMMRHGEAADTDGSSPDHQRQLTERGRRQVSELGRWLRGRVPLPELILHSPLVRTTQTAELLAAEWKTTQLLECSQLMAPGMLVERILTQASRTTASPMLCIGHQPDIGNALHQLIGGGRCEIPPGFCAAVHFSRTIALGAGSLKWVADPDWFG